MAATAPTPEVCGMLGCRKTDDLAVVEHPAGPRVMCGDCQEETQ